MTNNIRKLVLNIIVVLFVFSSLGCNTFILKYQLKKQLSQGGKFKTEIMFYDSKDKIAYVRIIDKSKFVDLYGLKVFYSYKYNGQEWVIYDPNTKK